MIEISCSKKEFEDIVGEMQSYKIFDSNLKLDFLEKCILVDEETSEKLEIQITSLKKYNSLDDVLKIVDLNKFGNYKDKKEFVRYIDSKYNCPYLVCRIKKFKNDIIIEDEKLLNLIDVQTLKQETLGLSGCLVYYVKTKDNKEAILKVQNSSTSDTLREECDVLDYLKGKMNVADIYYYNEYNGKEYLLREYLDGKPLYKLKNFGFKLGKELNNIHLHYSEYCKFKKFSVDNLLSNALDKIDVVYKLRGDYFKDYSKEELVCFLKDNKPIDDALIHGDFSLTNILDNNGKYYYIDLGNVSISTKYFDIYVLKKSLMINKLEDEWDEFLNGYGIKCSDIYMRWMELIELSYN